MGDHALEAAIMIYEPRQGGATQRYGCASGGGGCVSGMRTPVGSVSSGSSLFSSTSGLTDDDDGDDVTSSPPGRRPVPCSSSSSLTSSESSDKMQMDGAAAAAPASGPLYELSTMLDHLPALRIRTGLSKFYRGRSQSFTSLAEVSCVEDLAKKTTPYVRRTKASRCCAAALGAKNQFSKKIAKKVPRSPDGLLSRRARSISLLRGSSRPPAYHSKREVYRC